MYVRLVFRLLEMFKSSLFQTQRGCRRAEWGQRLSLDLANQLIIKLFNYECVWRTPSCCIFNSEEAGGMWERLRAPDDSFAGCSASSARAEDPTLTAEREGGLGGGGVTHGPRTAHWDEKHVASIAAKVVWNVLLVRFFLHFWTFFDSKVDCDRLEAGLKLPLDR